jgi:geranylgeranyl diphosphate synthase type II
MSLGSCKIKGYMSAGKGFDNRKQAAVQQAVDDFLRAYFEGAGKAAESDDPSFGRLVRVISEVTLTGGKRMRPYLVVLAFEGFHRANRRAILPVAAAAELVHIGLLIHDDIIDRDLVRRGVPNAAGRYTKMYSKYFRDDPHNLSHNALSAALLAGDYVLIAANELVRRSTLGAQEQLAAQQLLSNSIITVIGGELMDVESAFVPYEEVNALKIARLKTASYSFVSPLLLGATLGGANQAALNKLREFGISLGIAYQLADDLIGVFGDPSVTGKADAGDIREGKKTLLIEELRARAPGFVRRLETILGNADCTPADIAWVREQMVSSGALAAVQERIYLYIESAHKVLAEVPGLRDPSRKLLALLTEDIRQRAVVS